jgi:hypothetical protein|tara:strand:+ start:133 stop:759 length:627 start_codon:yes stop_codon:yes gene_type:complete
MNGANIFASIVIGFCGGSLIKAVTGPVIEIPNFTEEEPPSHRLVFVEKEIDGEIKYILTRVEDGSTPYTEPLEQVNSSGKMSPINGIIQEDWDALLEAIRIVESNNNPDAVGDSGNAIGVYQIWEDYHTDACMAGNITGEYLDCYDPLYAEDVFVEYMKRYAIESRLGVVTCEKVARMHHGGPNGWKWKSTEKYWGKVEPIFERLRRQ